MTKNKTQNTDKILNCESCDFNCSNKFDFNRHILTRKHINAVTTNDFTQKNANEYTCDVCSKIYKHQSSLCKHKKTCIEGQPYTDIIHKLNDDNQELRNLIVEQSKL